MRDEEPPPIPLADGNTYDSFPLSLESLLRQLRPRLENDDWE